MTDSRTEPEIGAADAQETPVEPRKKSISMHDGVPVWHDCCCCEAEPYWAELAEEMGVDLNPSWDTDKDGP
jgi:hypothetical protein